MSHLDTAKTLPWFTVLYAAASLLHFAHNAEFLVEYPNLPSWISQPGVYVAWIAVTAVGAFGYALLRLGKKVSALIVLALYACLGFDGFLHYQLAPFVAHTVAMNATILFEVAAAAALLIAVLRSAVEHFRVRAV